MDETFDLLPYLNEMKRGLIEEYEAIRDGRFRDEAWLQKRDHQEVREIGRTKPPPENPVEREHRLEKAELERRELDRLLSALNISWPTESSRDGVYTYPNTHEKEYGKYVREFEQHLELMQRRVQRDQAQRAKMADFYMSAGKKLADTLKYAEGLLS